MTRHFAQHRTSGFTIVELLVVIIVIGILATVVFVAYTGVQSAARDSSVLSDLDTLDGIQTQYGLKNGVAGKEWYSGVDENPIIDPDLNFTPSPGNVIDVVINSTDYCIRGYNVGAQYNSLENAATKESSPGACTTLPASLAASGDSGGGGVAYGDFIQTITNANCPSTLTRAVDARDDHTYWVQQLADGKCWMLTNLAYAGGGTNTYGDTKTLTDGTAGSTTYTVASYYVPSSGSNVTTEPTNPSTSTNGTGQYGYLYNWCGAMGGQATAACANATTPAPDTSTSICPFGWRLPTGNGGEFGALNTAINGGSTTTDAGLLSYWFGQYGGRWSNGFSFQGSFGSYWSSLQRPSGSAAYVLSFDYFEVYTDDNYNKNVGVAVRCLAD